MEMVLLSSGRLIDGFGIVDANSALLRKICNLHASHSEFRFPELISELKGHRLKVYVEVINVS